MQQLKTALDSLTEYFLDVQASLLFALGFTQDYQRVLGFRKVKTCDFFKFSLDEANKNSVF